MENKWEYDYSGLYQSAYDPNPAGYQALPPPALPPSKKPKKGLVKRIVTGALALVMVAGIGFGSGYAGFLTAYNNSEPKVVYPPAQSTTANGTARPASDLVSVINAVSPSVVAITTEQMVTRSIWGGQQVESGAGSGVVYTADGYIITNNHVVEGAQQIKVTLADDSEHIATLVGADPQSDIAVIKIDVTGLIPVVLGNSDTIQKGETAIAIGNPLGTLGGTVTNGIVSGLNRSINVEGNQMSLLQTNAAVSPGNSGGGLFNDSGELIGIVNAKSGDSNAEGLGFAIPVNTANQVAQDLIESGFVTGRPALGITVIGINDAQTAMQYGVSAMGVYVQSVTPDSGADAAGMKAGDRIISVDNKLIEETSDVTNALQSLSAGDTVQVQVDRNREMFTLNIVLGEKASA